jgi:hypothetical protein
MEPHEWPLTEIRRLAGSSGKPLEVSCAQALLAHGWTAQLGSHFKDGALDIIRELDVLAEKTGKVPNFEQVTFRLRLLVSCRGFLPDRAALAYSVSNVSVPTPKAGLLSSYRGRKLNRHGTSTGPFYDLEQAAAAELLRLTLLNQAAPFVAFDLLEYSQPKSGSKPAEYKRAGDGDRQLFTAVDSAIKAAFYWRQQQYSEGGYFAVLNVPICLLAKRFWAVCVDGGRVGEPELRWAGYQNNSYPDHPTHTQQIALVWSSDQISILIDALDQLFVWMGKEMQKTEYTLLWAA